MYSSEFAAAYVEFMNSGLSAEQLREILTTLEFQAEKSHWDKCFTKKNSNAVDDDGNKTAIDGKYFLSADQKLTLQVRGKALAVRFEGQKYIPTRIEMPAVILRNIRPEASVQEPTQVGKILTQMAKIDPATATPEQKAAAAELLARFA